MIWLRNPELSESDEVEERKYMQRFSPLQQGEVDDNTAGLSLSPWTEELAQNLIAQHELVWDGNGLERADRQERRRELAKHYRERIAADDLYYSYVADPLHRVVSGAGSTVMRRRGRSRRTEEV